MKDKTKPPGKRPETPPMPRGQGYESEETKRFKAEMARDIVCAFVSGSNEVTVDLDFIDQCCGASNIIYNTFFEKES